jgi:hypothetical protein
VARKVNVRLTEDVRQVADEAIDTFDCRAVKIDLLQMLQRRLSQLDRDVIICSSTPVGS